VANAIKNTETCLRCKNTRYFDDASSGYIGSALVVDKNTNELGLAFDVPSSFYRIPRELR
jgi:hypothetical protein